MRIILLVLTIALYWPLEGQIVFEEVSNLPGGLLRSINESRMGLQSAVSTEAIFGKTVTGSAWTERDQDVTDIYTMMYSPDGDLYTKNNEAILYSQDNGETFATIDFPNGIFSYENTFVYVLDDDALFISDYNTGYCYYSIDNGQSWHWSGQLFLSTELAVTMVDNYIYVADASWLGAGIIARIDVLTEQTEIIEIVRLSTQYEFVQCVVQEDGTVYFYAWDVVSPEGGYYLLEYKFGQELVSLGLFPPPGNFNTFFSIGSTIFTFGPTKAHVFNGLEFEPMTYIGLPLEGEKHYLLSENDHLYVIINDTRIFRSVGTLAYPGVISGKVYLDEDHGCIHDTTEIGLAFWNVTVEGEHFFRSGISGPDGTFRYSVPEGEYKVSAQPPGTGWELCENDINVIVVANQPNVTAGFLSQATEECANLSPVSYTHLDVYKRQEHSIGFNHHYRRHL